MGEAGSSSGRGGAHPHRDVPTLWQQFKEALVSNQNFEYLYWLQVGRTSLL